VRIATLILGLALMVIVGLQSCAVYLGESVTNEPVKTQGGAAGLGMAFLFLIGAAFALAFPLVSLVSFLLAGLVGLSVGATSSFSDLTIWGVVSLILAALSFFGWREKRKRRAASASRVA
jgi:hypothetical protein